MVFSDDESDWKMAITDWIQTEDRERLARDEHPYRVSPTGGPRRQYRPGPIRHFDMIEDTLAEYARLPPYRPKRHRERWVEGFQWPGRTVAVSREVPGLWHLATGIRYVDKRPIEYVVYCGAGVPFEHTTQRRPTGIGFDGSRIRVLPLRRDKVRSSLHPSVLGHRHR